VAGLAPGDHVRALALIIALMSLVSMVVPPLAGGISDALTRRGIPRRVPIWIGAALDVACLLMLSQVHTLPLFMTFVLLATMGANISLAAYQALIPDVVPKDAWGTASGIRSVAMLIGTILGFGVAAGTPPPTTFIGVAVAIGVGALVLLAEPERPAPAQEEHVHISDWHDFTVVFIARAFLAFGLALLMTFVLYYFRDILRVGNPSVGTALVGVASLVGAVISSLYLGWLSDRVPRKIVVAICGIPMALAAAGFAITPQAHLMYAYALLFGIGFGGIMSTGWALAIDSVPKLRDVARDLGIWGIAQNFPQVIAPLTGGAVLAAYGYSQMGYRVLFFVAAGSFALGSLTVLAVGKRPVIPWWGNPLRVASAISLGSYLRLRYRIRSWGALPKRRGPSLVISNHQIELDLMHPMATFVLRGGLRTPVLTASAKLMYEPGYFALRIPWLWRLFHNVNLGWLFEAMGMLPLENELQSRTIARWAWGVERRHGEQPLEAVFKPSVISAHGLRGLTTRDLFKTRYFKIAQSTYVRLSELLPAYRKEAMDDMRAGVEADLHRIERAMALGATFYVTPEGEYPSDGTMLPFRGIWDRLAPQAGAIYLAAISYDPFSARKLSQLYRIVLLQRHDRVTAELQAARPVTTSALLAEWFTLHAAPFTEEEAAAAIRERLRTLPREVFVDPELVREPSRLVVQAIRHLRDVGIVRAVNGTLMLGPHRRHPDFPQTEDIIAYQARFFAETLQGAGIISSDLHAPEPMRPKAPGLPA
ncbi:MAG TPA: MFS transporter, partial [Candidatus Baltobacteraceae bacterium]|nr:MFS transporter [Candidatus Baltobacteraceae bacterium]